MTKDGTVSIALEDDTYTFYFNSNGVMLTGLHRLKWSGGEDVFFFDKNGAMQTGGATVNVKFDKSGKLIGGM